MTNFCTLLMRLLALIFMFSSDVNAEKTHQNSCNKPDACRHLVYAKKINDTNKQVFVRAEFDFQTYKYPVNTRSFYSKQLESQTCLMTVDHVVSLKDAFDSGARSFSLVQKKKFANDTLNHVPACKHINSSKANLQPARWLERSTDGKGVEVHWTESDFCDYVFLYHAVKQKWRLSFHNNNKQLFTRCGIKF